MGTKDAKVNTLIGMNNVARYVRVEMAGVDMNEAQQIVGKQGKFEIRIQTTGNETEHVLYGDTITSVAIPTKDTSGNWGVGFTLSDAGAETFREAAIKYGATTDPSHHQLAMLLDNKTVYSAPLSTNLASSLQTETTRNMIASTGTGTYGQQQATNLEIQPPCRCITGRCIGSRIRFDIRIARVSLHDDVHDRFYPGTHHGRVRDLLPVPRAADRPSHGPHQRLGDCDPARVHQRNQVPDGSADNRRP